MNITKDLIRKLVVEGLKQYLDDTEISLDHGWTEDNFGDWVLKSEKTGYYAVIDNATGPRGYEWYITNKSYETFETGENSTLNGAKREAEVALTQIVN